MEEKGANVWERQTTDFPHFFSKIMPTRKHTEVAEHTSYSQQDFESENGVLIKQVAPILN